MHKIILVFFCILIHFIGSTQSSSTVIDTLWWDRMGYGGEEVLERMVVAEDNSLWAIGTTSSSELYGKDVYLVHLDATHQCLGSFSFGGNGVDTGVDLMFLPNGNLLLLGTTSSFQSVGYDVVLYVVDSNGQLMSTNIFEEEGWQFPHRFSASPNGDIAISGKVLNGNGDWDLELWKLINSGDTYDVVDQTTLTLNVQNLESTFIIPGNNDHWWGFTSYWSQDSIPYTRAFELDNQWSFLWDSTNVTNGDSILMHDAIVKDDALILVGGFYHNEQFRPQLMKWQSGLGMWSIANYPNYQQETMFHGVGYAQDSLVYCAVGWSFEFGFGMGGGFYNFFDTNDQWIGNGFIGGDQLCKMYDVVFDKNNFLHSVGLDNSHAEGMSQQAWLVRGNGCLFVQPGTPQIENAITPCFTVDIQENEVPTIDFALSHGKIMWNGEAQLIGAFDALGRQLSNKMLGLNCVQLETVEQWVLLQWMCKDKIVAKRVFVTTE